jgi:hypothetical protein
MTEGDIKRKLEQAIQLNSELPDLELKAAQGGTPHDIWKSISSFSHRQGGGACPEGLYSQFV